MSAEVGLANFRLKNEQEEQSVNRPVVMFACPSLQTLSKETTFDL